MVPDWTRRHLIYGSAGMAASGFMYSPSAAEPSEGSSPALQISPRDRSGKTGLKAAIIGETGAGNFGHGLDQIFNEVSGVSVVAVADANDEGRDAAKEKTGAERAYADFEEMLAKEKPDLVSIAPRWTNQHFAMTKAALSAGAHVYVEKPFTRTLAEADELLAIADQQNLKIAVAHQMRCDPHILKFREMSNRLIGDLVEMRVFGKMDNRAGGEDSLVLGTHLFDLVRFFGGEVEWATARIRIGGKNASVNDAHESEKENLGLMIGDDIYAHLAMDSGVNVTFQSRKKSQQMAGPWGIEFVGTKSKARLFANHPPTFSLLRSLDQNAPNRADIWKIWPDVEEGEAYHQKVEGLSGMDAANRLVVKDWLFAIANDKEPKSSGYRAMKALEIIHGIWATGLTGERVDFPLTDREHPLAHA